MGSIRMNDHTPPRQPRTNEKLNILNECNVVCSDSFFLIDNFIYRCPLVLKKIFLRNLIQTNNN